MDYPIQRQQLYKYFAENCDNLVLNDKLLGSLNNCFSASMETIKNVSDEKKKAFILLELTKNRHSCNQVIKLLVDSDELENLSWADELKKINTSLGRKEYPDDIEIEVTPTETKDAKGTESLVYPMTQKRRGKALIIDNVKDVVQRESQRFEHIFKKLLFEVESVSNLTANEINSKLVQLKDDINKEFDEQDFTPQALIVMIISHGSDENVYGKVRCNASNLDDQIPIHDIVDIFSANNFEFDGFVKLFFFTCCREIENEERDVGNMFSAFKCEFDNNSDTLVFHSCAEGYETYVDENNYYTYFGKYLSESIAQFAHKEDLVQIMNRTSNAMRSKYGKMGYFSPETRLKGLTMSVYFNPLWFDPNEEVS